MRSVPHLVLGAVFVLALAVSSGVALLLPLPDASSDYNTGGFLVRHSWVKFAQAAASPFRAVLSEQEETALVARFFSLNEQIAEFERVAGDTATSDSARIDAATQEEMALRERAAIENQVEQILEGRLTAAIKDAGLTRHVGRDVVWPPVNVEFEEPPAVLVRSPRSEIKRLADRLVDGELPVEEKVRLEGNVEADGETSALVVQIGAIAMYPAIVPPSTDYRDTLQTIAHEWVHHYLYFAPLGRSFYEGDKLITLNETVANLVGVELGDWMFERYPLEEPPAFVRGDEEFVVAAGGTRRGLDAGVASDASGSDSTNMLGRNEASVTSPRGRRSERLPYMGFLRADVPGWDGRAVAAPGPAAQVAFDFGREMRGLRLEVDRLLAEGRVEEAELAMEERRSVFVANGIYIRRINQAYFAFHGSYADTPASSDPIGPKMERLREGSVSVKAFLETVREFGSEEDLDAALR